MNTITVIVTACIITLISLLLKFIKLPKENVSLFLGIRKKSDEIMQMILQQQKTKDNGSTQIQHFRLTISDWFSTIAIVAISYLLLYEYLSTELVTRENVFKIGFLFSLLLFNIIFLAVSMIERRIIYWIDGFITVVEHIFELIRVNEKKEELIKSHSASTHPRAKKKKRTARSGKK